MYKLSTIPQLIKLSCRLFPYVAPLDAGAAALAAGAGPGGDARLSVLRAKQQQSKIEAVIGVAWSANGAQMVSADKGGQVAFWSLTGL